MRADGGWARHRSLALALAATSALAAPAAADTVYGTLQTQFQRNESPVMTVNPDGTLQVRQTTTEMWLKALDLHSQDYLRPDLLLDSNLRFTQLSYLDHPDLTNSLQGVLRLIHPYFQITASHQPTTAKVSTTPPTNTAAADTSHATTSTTHTTETLLVGHFAMPHGPQLDANWMRRSRSGTSIGDQSTTRNLRAAYDEGLWSVYGSVGDQNQRSSLVGGSSGTQRLASAGGLLRLPVWHATTSSLQYDLSQVTNEGAGVLGSRSRSQSATYNSAWQPGRTVTGTLNYQWRQSDASGSFGSSETDHDGSLLFRVLPNREFALTTGAGVRSIRTVSSNGLNRYVTAVLTGQGTVRRGWDVTGSATHTSNWDPTIGAYGVETAGGTTRMRFSKRAIFDGSLQLSANGDSASRAERYANVWNTRLQTTPLRSLMVTFGLRSQRVGPGLFGATGVSRGRTLDVSWKVAPTFDLLGSFAASGLLPDDRQRTSSKSVTARYAASSRWQFQGLWTEADQQQVVLASGTLARHDTWTGLVQYTPTRRLAMSGHFGVNDPGHVQRTRQADVTFTWSFGR